MPSENLKTRREFLKNLFVFFGGAVALGGISALAGCGSPSVPGSPGVQGAPGAQGQGNLVFQLSGRGIRSISNAAKAHNHNKIFRTEAAADANRAHPGDHSKIVSFSVGDNLFKKLFPNPNVLVADLRHL